MRGILGRFGLVLRCEKGEILRVAKCYTRFHLPKTHLVTWYSNDSRALHQVYHILLLFGWATSLEDYRAFRGGRTNSLKGEGYLLVHDHFAFSLPTRLGKTPLSPFNVDKVKDDVDYDQNTVEHCHRYTSGQSFRKKSVDDQKGD